MISKASVTFARISPRKVRYVIDLIRKKPVVTAQGILAGSPRRAGGILEKLLAQALDAAEKNSQVQPDELFVSKVTADGGPVMKRYRAGSMGRAGQIRKRTSHIHLELDRLAGAPVRTETAPSKRTAPKEKSAPDKDAAAKKGAASKRPAKRLVGAK